VNRPLPKPSPWREELEKQQIKSPSLLGEWDLGGEADKPERNLFQGCLNAAFFINSGSIY